MCLVAYLEAGNSPRKFILAASWTIMHFLLFGSHCCFCPPTLGDIRETILCSWDQITNVVMPMLLNSLRFLGFLKNEMHAYKVCPYLIAEMTVKKNEKDGL